MKLNLYRSENPELTVNTGANYDLHNDNYRSPIPCETSLKKIQNDH
jgi:hypothetical protein